MLSRDPFQERSSYTSGVWIRTSKVRGIATPQTFVSWPRDVFLNKDITVSHRKHMLLIQYIPVEICQCLLNNAVRVVCKHVTVPVGIVGDFEDGIGFIKSELSARLRESIMIALLGNTFVNLDRHEQSFLDSVHLMLKSGSG
ncbi:MAG: L-histidine N(alpha)-methyltransferase [Pyrinomonadaceae bacterium]|nr:L-histidine N(alpha)-methyltransferase [Pyrinomonadaceae bacterium]